MKDKKCNHKSYWEIYKVINFNRTFNNENGISFKCEKCNKKCLLKWKGYNKMKKSVLKSFFVYFMWMLPAIILIHLVATLRMHYLLAMLLITVFHFGSMYFIIKSKRLKISKNSE